MTMDCPKCWGKNKTCVRCGGDGKCPAVQLSPHFRLSELLASNTAKSKGLDNDPSADKLNVFARSVHTTAQPQAIW